MIAGAGLVWSIFSFIIDKRDKANDAEKRFFFKEFYELRDRIDREVETTIAELNNLKNIIISLNTNMALQKDKFYVMTDKFTDYSKEVRHLLEKHSNEILDLGKVIRIEGKY